MPNSGRIDVLAGPVNSGKSDEFARRISTCIQTVNPDSVEVVFPSVWPQRVPSIFYSADRTKQVLTTASDRIGSVLDRLSSRTRFVFIESLHAFGDFDTSIVQRLDDLTREGITVVASIRETLLDGSPTIPVGRETIYSV